MNDDQLDDEIRALLSAVVADAPAVKPLPALDDVAVAALPTRRSRGRAVVWTAIAVAASLVAFTVFWSSRNDNQRVTAATSSSLDGSAAWPSDLAVVVANDGGVQEVGPLGTERLLAKRGVARAYELADGSLIYQEGTVANDTVVDGGDIIWRSEDGSRTTSLVTAGDTQLQLFDASLLDGDLGRLQLVYGLGETVSTWFQPDEPRSWVLEGGWAVGHFRWNIAGADRVMAGWTDDTGRRGTDMRLSNGEVVDVGDRFEGALFVVAAPDGRTGRLDGDGVLTVFGPNGAVTTVNVPNTQDGVDLQLRGAALVVNYHTSRAPVLIDLRDGATYEVPVIGYATVSDAMNAPAPLPATTTATAPTTTTAFPEGDIRAIVTQRDTDVDGVWIVTDDEFAQVDATSGGPAYLAGDNLLFSPKAGGIVALDRTTGATQTLRSTGQVVDAAVLGGELYYLYTDYRGGVFVSLYLHGPAGDVYIAADEGSDTGHLS
ncbi:MAG: hypothetical protein WCC60_20635, partial [Ilumatobacteraceae bacterium]